MPKRHPARWLLAIVTITVGVFVSQSVSAQNKAPTIGLVPEVEGRELVAEDLPDLIPLADGAGEVIGYVRAEEAFVELFDASKDVVAYAVYEKDGVTLIGHEVLGKGFVPGTEPIERTRPAVEPPPLD